MESGKVAPMYLFLNGPAEIGMNRARFFGLYGSNGTPTVKIDGFGANSSPSTYADKITKRLAVPALVDIVVNMVGDETGGTAYVEVTAEEQLPAGTIVVMSVIVEDHEVATSAWGGYKNKEMMWIPVVTPLRPVGYLVKFTAGSYPQTLKFSRGYTLNPADHPYDNLGVVTFVQYNKGAKEVLNAHYVKLSEANGITEGATFDDSSLLSVWPNPTNGRFSVSAIMPQSVTGTIDIFDITGRSVEQFIAGSAENVSIQESGVYFVRLATSTGEVVTKQIAVVK